jgi:hypothetical protein
VLDAERHFYLKKEKVEYGNIKNLEQLAFEEGIPSIYKTCDMIEGLEESLILWFYCFLSGFIFYSGKRSSFPLKKSSAFIYPLTDLNPLPTDFTI